VNECQKRLLIDKIINQLGIFVKRPIDGGHMSLTSTDDVLILISDDLEGIEEYWRKIYGLTREMARLNRTFADNGYHCIGKTKKGRPCRNPGTGSLAHPPPYYELDDFYCKLHKPK